MMALAYDLAEKYRVVTVLMSEGALGTDDGAGGSSGIPGDQEKSMGI